MIAAPPLITVEVCQEAGAMVARDVQLLAGTRWPISFHFVVRDAWRVKCAKPYTIEWGTNYQTVSSRLSRSRSPSLPLVLMNVRLAIAALLLEGWSGTQNDVAHVLDTSNHHMARRVRRMRGVRMVDWRARGYDGELELLHRFLTCSRPWPRDLFLVERAA